MNVTDLVENRDSAERGVPSDSLEEAFARYQNELLGTLYYLVGNRDDALDALQDAFIKCWRHQDRLAEVRNLKAWIFRVVLNTGRDVRQTAWRRRRESLPGDSDLMECRQAAPPEQYETQERLERVRRAVAELRLEEQQVFLLRQNGDLTYEEIAAATGLPTGTVKTRMRLALTKLRLALGEA